MFTEDDIRQRAAVAVIGSEVKNELFGDSDAVGKKIKVKDRSLRVVGVLPPKGQVFIMNVDKMILAPVSTVQKYLLGISHYHAIMVEAKSEELVPVVEADIKRTIRDLHDTANPEFQQDMLLTVQSSLDKMKRLMLQLREGATPPGSAAGVELEPMVRRLQDMARQPRARTAGAAASRRWPRAATRNAWNACWATWCTTRWTPPPRAARCG